jgi:hypothetical protein
MSDRSSAPFRPIAVDTARPNGIEQRKYPRYALDLPGRFMRADKLDYSCRLKDISIVGASMVTPTNMIIGEKVIVYLLHLGGLEGAVTRRFEGGFAMNIAATQRKREKLAAQIMRLSEHGPIPETEERQHPRLPCNELCLLVLQDGTAIECVVTDRSVSGASIATPVRPSIGSEVMLGGRPGTIVRHHDEGIGIEFLNQRLEELAAFERYARSTGSQ